MEIKIVIDGVEITLNSNDTLKVRETLDKIIGALSFKPAPAPAPVPNVIMDQMRNILPPDPVMPAGFVPPSEKQKRLLMKIPEVRGRDINTISKKECGEIIERWNKSRSYSYVDPYGRKHY